MTSRMIIISTILAQMGYSRDLNSKWARLMGGQTTRKAGLGLTAKMGPMHTLRKEAVVLRAFHRWKAKGLRSQMLMISPRIRRRRIKMLIGVISMKLSQMCRNLSKSRLFDQLTYPASRINLTRPKMVRLKKTTKTEQARICALRLPKTTGRLIGA